MRLRRWSCVGYSDNDAQSIERWLARNQAAFSALRRGANTPHYWPIYEGNDSTLLEVSIVRDDMNIVERDRHVTLAFKQQIIREAHQGQMAGTSTTVLFSADSAGTCRTREV